MRQDEWQTAPVCNILTSTAKLTAVAVLEVPVSVGEGEVSGWTGRTPRESQPAPMGRYGEFDLQGSGRPARAVRLGRSPWPQHLAQRPLELPPFAGHNVCLVPVSVTTPSGADRLLTLQISSLGRTTQ